jgi:hypothetical protein
MAVAVAVGGCHGFPTRTPELPKGNGMPCQGQTERESAFCADGVCCDAACDGQLDFCAFPGLIGSCVDVIPRDTKTPTATRAATPTPTRKAVGEPCGLAIDCDSTFCVDQVCCNGRCDGLQELCNVTGFLGICVNVAPVPTAVGLRAD